MRKLSFLLFLLATFSCTQKMNQAHNNMNSLDWAGVYTGTFQVENGNSKGVLHLNNDGSFILNSQDKDVTGTFEWQPNGQHILLKSGNQNLRFFVGENYLTQIRKNGKTIYPDGQSIRKVDEQNIRGKYWKLVELYGKPLKKTDGKHEPYFIIDEENNQITGFAGCNSLAGEVIINDETLRISFSKLAGTLKACDDMEIEDQLLEALKGTDNYSTDGKILTLNRARMAPLAKFEVVYL